VVGGDGLCLLAEKGVAGCSGRWEWGGVMRIV
jgi:hypothetical protein